MFPILFLSLTAHADPDDLTFDLEGYYRMRTYSISNLQLMKQLLLIE